MSDRKATWIRILGVFLFFGLLAAAWQWTPLKGLLDLQRVADWVEPHRTAWYAPPAVVAAFVVLGVLMVPVLFLITATGIAFGPWLGPIYALAGALTSASVGFAFGRWAGRRRIEQVGGPKIGNISRKIEANGTLAVYVIRKIPMPFLFSNLVIGASRVRFRDFLLGSTLGLGPVVIALAGFGYHLIRSVEDPTPGKIGLAAAFLAVPLGLAWTLNRVLRHRGSS
jgi:phospholipase D1/2